MIAVRTNDRASVLTILASCATVLFLTACGSDEEPTETSGQPAAASTTAQVSDNAGEGFEDVSNWVESEPAPAAPASSASDTPADPDAVIARYERECTKTKQTAECRALRRDVEAIFLESLVGVRATNATVDSRWYRLAAASELPQLACIGVMELIWDPKRTAPDDSLIARALDSPYRGVRGAVFSNSAKAPAAVARLMQRNSGGTDYFSLSGVCVDSARDAVPGTKWAGGYPGAQFRPFASDESRRWFTTPDAPEKVISWFHARGKVARTAEQMAADGQAKFMEEMLRLSENPEQDNTEAMMALMTSQGSDGQWSERFRGMEGIGEIVYVKIGANQAIAIFSDDFLQATSIVAPRPIDPIDLAPDIEALTEEQEMRSILGY